MTETDRVIEEIREGRYRLSRECGHDIRRLVELLGHYEQRYAEQVRRYERLRTGPPPRDDATD
ncbi:MAG: hypothetical protein ACLF0G_17710 [Candidatus Brocadiia bacterium]